MRRLDLPALQFRLLVPTRPRPCSTLPHQPRTHHVLPSRRARTTTDVHHYTTTPLHLLSRFRKSSHIAFMLCYATRNRRCRSQFQRLGGGSRTRYPPRGPSSLDPFPFRPVTRVCYDWDAAYRGYRPILELAVLYYLCCYCIA
jgi:hypothetical protein